MASAGINIAEKFLLPNVLYVNSGGTVGTIALTAKNIVTRTENGVNNFYLTSFTIEGFFNVINAVATRIGTCSLQVPIGTTVSKFNLINGTTSAIDRIVVTPETPIVVSNSFAISCANLTTTATNWFINFTGWEY